MKLVQTENGLWRTILDDEESYEEVSASAGIAAAMVEMNNPLHAKYVQKALKGILDNVSADGKSIERIRRYSSYERPRGIYGRTEGLDPGMGTRTGVAFFTAVLKNA